MRSVHEWEKIVINIDNSPESGGRREEPTSLLPLITRPASPLLLMQFTFKLIIKNSRELHVCMHFYILSMSVHRIQLIKISALKLCFRISVLN